MILRPLMYQELRDQNNSSIWSICGNSTWAGGIIHCIFNDQFISSFTFVYVVTLVLWRGRLNALVVLALYMVMTLVLWRCRPPIIEG